VCSVFLSVHVFMCKFVIGCCACVVLSVCFMFVGDVDLHLCILGRICSRFDSC
jgi:hypothetical protein